MKCWHTVYPYATAGPWDPTVSVLTSDVWISNTTNHSVELQGPSPVGILLGGVWTLHPDCSTQVFHNKHCRKKCFKRDDICIKAEWHSLEQCFLHNDSWHSMKVNAWVPPSKSCAILHNDVPISIHNRCWTSQTDCWAFWWQLYNYICVLKFRIQNQHIKWKPQLTSTFILIFLIVDLLY